MQECPISCTRMRLYYIMIRLLIYLLFSGLCIHQLYAQSDRVGSALGPVEANEAETEKIYPFLFKSSDTLVDSIIEKDPFQYDPSRRNTWIGNLTPGYMGGEILNTLFDGHSEVGFEIGHHAYDAYKFRLDTVPFYKRRIPYTHLLYAQGNTQTRTQTEADFGASFDDQLIAIGYRRIYNQGIFQNQNALHTALYLGYLVRKEKWNLGVLFGSNVIQDRYNGGITTDTLFGSGLSALPANIPIRTNTLEGRHQDRQYLLNFEYKLSFLPYFKKLRYQSYVKDGYIKVFDTQPDTLIYSEDFYREIGLRQFINRFDWQNKISLVSEASSPLKLEAGIQFNRVSLTQEPVANTFGQFYVFGNLLWDLSTNLTIQGETYYGFQQNQAEYSIDGKLNWKTRLFHLSARYRNSSTVPDLIERRMILLNEEIYNTDFTRIIHNQIGGSIDFPYLGIQLHADLQTVFNYRFWTFGSIQPSLADFSILQIRAEHKLSYGILKMKNRIAYQSRDKELLPLPDWQGMHQLYVNSYLLKKTLEVSIGGELRYYLNYDPALFQPFLGTFIIPEESNFEGHPYILDLISKVRIDNFHFLFRLENLQTIWEDAQFYSHYRTPFPGLSFRLGVQWNLKG